MSYERQETLGIVREQKVAVIGCGGVGSWIALQLALAGVERIDLFDGDSVDGSNLNRLPVPEHELGSKKTNALYSVLLNLRSDSGLNVSAHGKFIPKLAEALGVKWDWLVVSTDTLSSRRAAYKYAQEHGARYIEASANGHAGSVSGSPAEWDTETEDVQGYNWVPVHVGPCVMAAAMACYYVLMDREIGDGIRRVDWASDKGLKLYSLELKATEVDG